MTNLYDYLTWRGDLSFEADPVNAVDGVIFARLAYLPIEKTDFTGGTLTQAAEALFALPGIGSLVWQPEDLHLLRALCKTARFAALPVERFESRMDEKTQFFAMTLRTGPQERFLAFRGTDDSLVGWEEDLNMGFTCPVPAQSMAADYLCAEPAQGTLRLGGHSKGGNLAVYASAFSPETVQSRIVRIYNYDGPGFDDPVLVQTAYRRICSRIVSFIPQSSVVGRLFGHPEHCLIVHSERMGGVSQHNIYNWEIVGKRFATLEALTNSSRFIDSTVKSWLAAMDAQQRAQLVEVVYRVLTETNATSVRELEEDPFGSAKNIVRTLRSLDEPTRRGVSQLLSQLAKSARSGWSDRKQRPPEGGEVDSTPEKAEQ